MRLFHRTTRSVSLTEAGAQLFATVGPALAALQRGVEEARTSDEAPAGVVRITTSYVAYAVLFEPHLREFAASFPGLVLELAIDSAASDIVGRGFDAGVRPGRALQPGMVAVPLGPVLRLIVVGAPDYLARAGRPQQPAELRAHACIRQRVSSGSRFLDWQLRSGRKPVTTLDVRGPLIVDDMRAALGAARAGAGLAYVFDQFAAADLARGTLEQVLPKHALVREAFHLYYASRQLVPRKLRVVVDWFRAKNPP